MTSGELIGFDWQITSLCNRSCPYCFGPKGIEHLGLTEMKRIASEMKHIGVRKVGISGGEPLLHPHIDGLLTYLAGKGMSIYLSTNCDFYFAHADVIAETVSVLGVPIDGPDGNQHDTVRGQSSFENVLNAAKHYCSVAACPQLKVGTVVTAANCASLPDIERLVARFGDALKCWKLHHLISFEKNANQVNALRSGRPIGGIANLGQYIPKEKIIDGTLETRSGAYLFLQPDGSVFVPLLSEAISEERVVGNLCEQDIAEVLPRFYACANLSKYEKRCAVMT